MSSGSFPYFRELAKALIEHLVEDQSMEGQDLLLEARQLLARLQTLETNEDSSEEKTKVIAALVDTNRRALDHISRARARARR